MSSFTKWLEVVVVSMLVVSPAAAHHSSAQYFLDTEVTLEGRVAEFRWANPHVYIYVEIGGGESAVWQIETQPPSVLSRYGWTRETLRVGEPVIVRGRAPRDAQRREALGLSLQRADGTVLELGFNIPVLSDRGTPSQRKANSLSGIWLAPLDQNLASRQLVFGPSEWPLTEKGAEAVETYREESMHPAIDCVPNVAPFQMVFPGIKVIEIGEDAILIRTDLQGVERTIRMNVSSHDGAALRLQGHSIGSWEGNVLVVDTTHFADHRIGNGDGLPSGQNKHLVERFELNEDGTSLTYRFELEDPEYLAAPVSGEYRWEYRPNLEYAPAECDLDTARRFIRN